MLRFCDKLLYSFRMDISALQAKLRDSVLAEYTQGMAEIREEFQANPSSRKAARNRAMLVDRTITHIRRAGEEKLPKLPKMAILATGGYGRNEMFFYSDVDIMFVIEEGGSEKLEPLINLILYLLWDLKLKVGHSVRTVKEAMSESLQDMKTRTNLLEARRITGSRTLAKHFLEEFDAQVIEGHEREFIDAKLLERAQRHQQFGESRALLEPNIKEGKGGLRDLQTLMWLMRACYGARKMAHIAALGKISDKELRDFRRARKFLHLVRLHLHDIAGRADERLSFDAQRQIAERFGYRGTETANQSVERFMKRYFQVTRTVGQLTRTLCLLLEDEWGNAPRTGIKAMWKRQKLPKGLEIKSNRLNFSSPKLFEQSPELMVGVFWYSHRLEIDIHPAAWQMLTRNIARLDKSVRHNQQANDYFLQLLLDTNNPVATLKHMNESGVLGKFIPDFGLLAGQMQFDLYHTFTVDEHILTAVGYLHQLEAAEMAEIVPLATTLMPQIQMRRVLYLGLLCHDIAKGRGGDHHLKGVDIGFKLAKRFGFEEAEQKTLAWLIEYHQHMSMVAFKRDLDDPQTIENFVQEVDSLNRLQMLYALTIADIHAVAPNIWNSWKGTLLETLYRKAERLLSGVDEEEEGYSTAILQKELGAEMVQTNPKDIAAYIEGADSISLEAYDMVSHSRIMSCWLAVHQGEDFGLRFWTDQENQITQATIATADRHGLFAQIAGVFAICGASITDARIFTRKDDIVIDRFAIQDENGKAFFEDRRQDRIRQRLKQVLSGELELEQAVEESEQRYPDSSYVFSQEPQILFDNEVSENHTLIELQCVDKRGLLYRVTNALAALGLSISTAHIATYGEKVVDVFYVKDGEGNKLTDAASRKKVRTKLLKQLQ